MPSQRVLICGAGVAGSIAAFWLARYDFEVVVIERSKIGQKLGQGIEIEDPVRMDHIKLWAEFQAHTLQALQVVKEMGILEKLQKVRTAEEGFQLVDQRGTVFGTFQAGGFSPTGALELMRGDLTEILYQAADESPNVTYHHETTIQSLRQTDDKVIVDMENRINKATRTEEFDFVIGADGQNSRTRGLIFGSPEDLFKPIGASVAYFSVPEIKQDGRNYSRLCHFSDRRAVWTRPAQRGSNLTSVYFIHCGKERAALQEANASSDRLKQKQVIAEVFKDCGWETPHILEEMMKTNNFYSNELEQVKLKAWSQHRVALVGDAAWAPTPFTGEGNHLAILGGWTIAQELSRNRTPAGFQNYEKRMRSLVTNAQQIPLGGYMPNLCVPSSAVGVWVLRRFVWLVTLALGMFSKPKTVEELDADANNPQQAHEFYDLQIEKTEKALR